MFKKKIKYQDPSLRPPKAMMQLIDSFAETFKPVEREEYAEEIFTIRRLREYFQAWPVPKMPDPLPPYINELERHGFAMQTGYDGLPALFCVRWKMNGEICSVSEDTEKEEHVRTGLASMKALIGYRMTNRPDAEDDEESEDEGEE